MRVRKDLQQNLGLINTIRNINKLNPSHNINLTNVQFGEKNNTIILQKTSPNNNIPIKVKLVKSNQNQNTNLTQQNFSQIHTSPQKKLPIYLIKISLRMIHPQKKKKLILKLKGLKLFLNLINLKFHLSPKM